MGPRAVDSMAGHRDWRPFRVYIPHRAVFSKEKRMSKQIRSAFPLVFGLAVVLAGSGAVQAADNWMGTWKLNVAKSKYSPGPAPKSNTAKYEASEGGMMAVTDGMNAEGKPTQPLTRRSRSSNPCSSCIGEGRCSG